MTLVANEAPAAYWRTHRAPIGEILLVADDTGLRELHLPGCFAARDDSRASPRAGAHLPAARCARCRPGGG